MARLYPARPCHWYIPPSDTVPRLKQSGPLSVGKGEEGLASWWGKEVWGKWSISSTWISITGFQCGGEDLETEVRDEGGKGEERRRILQNSRP